MSRQPSCIQTDAGQERLGPGKRHNPCDSVLEPKATSTPNVKIIHGWKRYCAHGIDDFRDSSGLDSISAALSARKLRSTYQERLSIGLPAAA